jgi:hypothetical protein
VLPGTKYAQRGDIHVAYEVMGGGDIDLVLVSEWFSHLEAWWDTPSFDRFLRRLSLSSRLILGPPLGRPFTWREHGRCRRS